MRKILYIAWPLTFLLSIFVVEIQAQDSVKTEFFPYQTGDFWIYEEYSQVKQEVVNEIKYRVYTD
ncbi:MAG: hypothetical protein RI564_13630, partial [Gracilimonas sp.]|nr:hypothetical protein [Gracilimonas sp.]